MHFTIRDDNIAVEGNETFIASFELPRALGILRGEPSTLNVTIIDDDGIVVPQIFESVTFFHSSM